MGKRLIHLNIDDDLYDEMHSKWNNRDMSKNANDAIRAWLGHSDELPVSSVVKLAMDMTQLSAKDIINLAEEDNERYVTIEKTIAEALHCLPGQVQLLPKLYEVTTCRQPVKV